MMALSVMFQSLFYFVLLYSTLFSLSCTIAHGLQLDSWWLCHARFRTIAEFISFSCKLQPICSERASAALYVCIILLHNTYIHTYIPPLGGVCMYVCMYIVKNNNYSLQFIQFSLMSSCTVVQLLMMHFDELLQCSV